MITDCEKLEKHWYHVLTNQQRLAWINFATYCGADFFGGEYKGLTGIQTFVKANLTEAK